jgi:Rps23 Pro-64 3,4-dihydroxylase Tpa1-like proline 4-hydroxylase
MDRVKIADHLCRRLSVVEEACTRQFASSARHIGHFFLDDVLPADLTKQVYEHFPAPEKMTLRRSVREYKYVGAQMDQYHPLLEELVYAFQDPRVVALIGRICGIERVFADEQLYGSGLSLMGRGAYLNPHLDNSHDHQRRRWRVCSLLFFVTPDWGEEHGGNLELWAGGLRQPPVVVSCRFNRLVVMATHQTSWHSVQSVRVDKPRCCVSNYFYSPRPWRDGDAFRVTSFRGRPGQPLIDIVLQCDAVLRMGVRKVFEHGMVDTRHRYRRIGRVEN